MVKLTGFIIEAPKAKNKSEIDTDLLKQYISQLEDKIKGNRRIMYYDIINLIAKEGYRGENVSGLIRWCGNKIKNGYFFIDFYYK